MVAPTLEPIEAEELLTGEALFALGDIGPAELVKGKIQQRMPTGNLHGRIESLLTFFLLAFIRRHDFGHVLSGEVGLYTGRNPDTVRGFDLAYISHERFAQVHVFSAVDRMRIFKKEDVLDGGELLPDFQLPLQELFREL